MFIDKRSTLNNIFCFWVAEIVGIRLFEHMSRTTWRTYHYCFYFYDVFPRLVLFHPRANTSLIHSSWYVPQVTRTTRSEKSQMRLWSMWNVLPLRGASGRSLYLSWVELNEVKITKTHNNNLVERCTERSDVKMIQILHPTHRSIIDLTTAINPLIICLYVKSEFR